MANWFRRPGGAVVIQFSGLDKRKRTLSLGDASDRTAERAFRVVETLLDAARYSQPAPPDALAWLESLPDETHTKFVVAGLVNSRAKREAMTLGPFLDQYIAKRTDLKGGTLVFYSHTVENLKRFFGDDKRIDDVTPADADDFRRWLGTAKASRQSSKRLAVATINRRCIAARTIFRDAVRRKLIGENPFSGVGAGPKANPERSRYIKPETISTVLESAPHDEWRLLISLSRFAGLRIPSEALTLAWDDVDWAGNRLTVRSPKTEHHVGKAQRTIPLFPEVREYLDRLWSVAPEGATLVFSRLQREAQFSATGWKAVNLRTTFLKILRRAGVEPWPRAFHNMRASCQTDLEQRFPSYVVCQWMGNSETVAKAHYLQVLPEHFDDALLKALPEAPETGGDGRILRSEKRQNPAKSRGFAVSAWAALDSNQ